MNGKPISILVVGAEPAEAEALTRGLPAAGLDAELRAAGSLREYREMVAASPPDLALVGLPLPGGRFEDVLPASAEAGKFPVLVLVPPGDAATAAALVQAGAMDCVIRSPEALAALPVCVGRVLREWDLRQAHRLDQQRLGRAQRLAESLATLAAGIAHDLANALAPISMSIELARETGGTLEESALRIVDTGTRRATELVRQLASLSQTEPESRFSFQPRHLVKAAERLIRGALPQSIDLANHCPKDLWLITADPVRFQEVALKLSLCAREAMPEGGCLALSAANVELDAPSASRLEGGKPGRFVCLEVRHTGSQRPPAGFMQSGNPASSAPGLEADGIERGLAMSSDILRGHSGFLVVDGEAEQALVLRAFFPAVPIAGAGKPGAPAGGLRQGAGQTVLVVDDEPLLRNMVMKVLARLGFHVLSAADGVEALGLCARHLADVQLVLSDLDLPHMSGLALLRTVRQMKGSLAMMVLAGCCSEEQRAELAALNVTTVLTKPFAQEELLRALRQTFPHACPG